MPTQPLVPNPLDASRWENIEPLCRALLERPVNSAAEFERWLLDRSELDAACAESRAILSIAMTCQTDDPEKAGAYSRYIEEVPPRLHPNAFELDKKQAALHTAFPLDKHRYEVLERAIRTDVELFRAENVPLMTELDRMGQEFQRVAGAMTVHFDGQERALPQMTPYLQSTDRSVRESAWRKVSDRRLADKDAIDALYDSMIATRDAVGRNAGFDNFRGYAFKSMRRYDYTPRHCEDFHAAAEKHAVPFLRRLNDRRKRNLSLTSLRPWDLSVDEKGRPALKPFTTGDDLVQRTRRVFARLDPTPRGLNEMFRSLGDNGSPGTCLDLDARKGKAPGGYQEMLHRSRRPFIFMNAAGVHRDMETMVHEAGHAFHSMLSKDEPLVAYREAPIEFCEFASMGMEMLTMPFWDEYYHSPTERARAVREHLEQAVTLLTWIAQIDAFQHWVYVNPRHTHDERNAHWLHLDARFGAAVDWSGLADARAWQWQRQLHLFLHPFYFIEYAVAQLGALGLWLHALEKGAASALERYKRALAIGGARPLPELFEAAGLPFDFGEATVARLVGAVEREVSKMTE